MQPGERTAVYKKESAFVYTVDFANPALNITAKASRIKIFFSNSKHVKMCISKKKKNHKQDVLRDKKHNSFFSAKRVLHYTVNLNLKRKTSFKKTSKFIRCIRCLQ